MNRANNWLASLDTLLDRWDRSSVKLHGRNTGRNFRHECPLSTRYTRLAFCTKRARVTSVDYEKRVILIFVRSPPLPRRFDRCSFVVRSLNGPGGRTGAFLIYVYALREKRKSTNDALCDDAHEHSSPVCLRCLSNVSTRSRFEFRCKQE